MITCVNGSVQLPSLPGEIPRVTASKGRQILAKHASLCSSAPRVCSCLGSGALVWFSVHTWLCHSCCFVWPGSLNQCVFPSAPLHLAPSWGPGVHTQPFLGLLQIWGSCLSFILSSSHSCLFCLLFHFYQSWNVHLLHQAVATGGKKLCGPTVLWSSPSLCSQSGRAQPIMWPSGKCLWNEQTPGLDATGCCVIYVPWWHQPLESPGCPWLYVLLSPNCPNCRAPSCHLLQHDIGHTRILGSWEALTASVPSCDFVGPWEHSMSPVSCLEQGYPRPIHPRSDIPPVLVAGTPVFPLL